MNYRRNILSLLLTCLALQMTSCVTTGSNQALNKTIDQMIPEGGHKQALKGALEATRDWTPEEEHQLGQDMSAILLGASPLVANSEAQQYVNHVGMWLALQTEQPQIPWRFGIIDTPNINAFAAPGGYIFITRGLFLNLSSEAELAGVLGHEISHVLKKHHIQVIKKRGAGDVVFGLLKAKAEKSAQVDMTAINNLTRNLYSAGLDKADEYEADRMGVVLAARAGYSAFGLPAVLQMYAAAPQDASFTLLFATHPAPNDRLNALDQLMSDRFNDLNAGLTKFTRLETMQRKLSYQAPQKPTKNSGSKTKK
ncbi:MAG: peptidase M48 [Betaproteobacteria bacterium HGW-Betaproteobacteria-22]|nr:MAG: peptidase M48 [Betaproteobacteria bacterium HGW-Betaproteobacteria-22]